jgi:hypothetical protein
MPEGSKAGENENADKETVSAPVYTKRRSKVPRKSKEIWDAVECVWTTQFRYLARKHHEKIVPAR